MDKNKAALIIQRFWQKRQNYKKLAGCNNYDYYLSLLNLSDNQDPFTALANMMYGRVIATPACGFPFLQQANPHLGMLSNYHRNDLLGSKYTSIILDYWGIDVDSNCMYIPVVQSNLGTIDDALRALNWPSSDYDLISPAYELAQTPHLKFIKIKNKPWLDLVVSNDNPWTQLSSLGIIASPWLLSISALEAGFIPEGEKTDNQSISGLSKQSLERQPQTMEQLKSSEPLKKLGLLKEKVTSEAAPLAKALYAMIHDLPTEILAPDIIARLALFIETALLMHHDDHAHLADLAAPIIHEMSLLILKYMGQHNEPLIDIDDYQSVIASDMAPWINLQNPDYQFIALPAHSGSHANFIASQMAHDIASKDGSHTVRRVGGEYWEVMEQSKEYTLVGNLVNDHEAQTVRFSAGPIGDYNAGTYPAIDINKLIRAEAKTNPALQTLIIDITSASYQHLQLAPDVLQIITEKKISLVFWESCQKFGLLHTDQAQYGRVFAYCHKANVPSSYIESLKDKAASDMYLPDAQIGAFIGKNSSTVLQQIKARHFDNGAILRQVLANNNYKGINQSRSYDLCVDEQQDPFFFNSGTFNNVEINKIKRFFTKLDRVRASFGHRYTTQEGESRISAGAENKMDVALFAMALTDLIQLAPSALYLKIIQDSEHLNVFDQDQLIRYLSLIKAWPVCAEPWMTITPRIAERLYSIITNSDILQKTLLAGSQHFVSDIYRILRLLSPFTAMLSEAAYKRNAFAIQLFTALDDTYIKTGKIAFHDAIKKAIRITEGYSVEQVIDESTILKHKQILLSGEYSPSAKKFFGGDALPRPDISPSTDSLKSTPPIATINMQILNGFIAVVGIAAIATAFLLLNAATCGTAGLVVAGVGVAATLAGVGLFATKACKNSAQPINAPLVLS